SLPQISRAPNRSRSGSSLAVDASSPLLPPAVAASPSLSPPPLSPSRHLPLVVAASPTSPTPSRRRRLPLPATFLSPSPPPPSPPPAPAKNLWELRCAAPATPCRAGREPLVGLVVALQPRPAALAPFASTATTTKERPPHLPPRPPRRIRSAPPGRDAAPTTAATLESTGSTQSPPKMDDSLIDLNDTPEDAAGGGVHEPSMSGSASKVGATKNKQANFSAYEDNVLCKSWLEISCDPITNTGQRRESFWIRVVDRYNSKRGRYPKRTKKSISSR
ncbi:unnamed protein product, partial [Urochloa humidicola]